MRKIIIDKSEDGIKLIKYLQNIFKEMPDSLLHKLIRKKYFKINNSIATGKEILKTDDEIEIYLGEDSFNKFYNNGQTKKGYYNIDVSIIDRVRQNIVYEDENLIIFNKWQGLLSQNDRSDDLSVNELLNKYLQVTKSMEYNKSGVINELNDEKECAIKNSYSFIPSVVNRLDRNTEGLIIFAKTYIFSREISKMINDNKIDKYYKTIVNGKMNNESFELVNLYKKDEKNNKAIIKDIDNINNCNTKQFNDTYNVVKLKYNVIDSNMNFSFLDIKLITGKSHQIRAQLAHIGHPIICDKKYMDKSLYEKNLLKFGFKNQKLVCYKIIFSDFEYVDLKYLSNKKFEIMDNYRGIYDEIQ